jgi:hypothetical protein
MRILCLVILLLSSVLQAEQVKIVELNSSKYNNPGRTFAVQPIGRYATIKNEKTDEFIKAVFGADGQKSLLAQKEYLENLGNYAPAAHFAMTMLMVEAKRYKEACLFYELGILRTKYDILRCADRTVGGAPLYAQVGRIPQNIKTELSKEIDKNKKMYTDAMELALEADQKLPYNYDYRWVNLYGMRCMTASMNGVDDNELLTKPESEWGALRKQAVENYQKAIDKNKQIQ